MYSAILEFSVLESNYVHKSLYERVKSTTSYSILKPM